VNQSKSLFLLAGMCGWLFSAGVLRAQDAPDAGAPPQAQPQSQQREGAPGGEQGGRSRPLFGKITALRDGGLDITRQDGQTVSVKLTAQTEFRKDRESAKISDFKVGDVVMIRGDENADHSVTARMVGARTGGGPGGPGIGPQGGGGAGRGLGSAPLGTLGKDYVSGEVKSIDAPRLTVLRTDNVTQTLELNEETTLRRGRDSITMPDIQVGDHLMARGAVQKDVFVPKGVMVMNAEQWKRMQERGEQNSGARPTSPEAATPKPQEQPN
jgi:Domain of unknown function (DUF5666)